jgi:hypothetical protein
MRQRLSVLLPPVGRQTSRRDGRTVVEPVDVSLEPSSGRALLALCQPGVVDRTCPCPDLGGEERRAASGSVYEAPDDLASQMAHTSRAMSS